ncbi:MAG: class I SAM-dependent methyltransferase [Acidimicrobiales bacterium]
MLTVDFERMRLGPGERLLDMGCGGGRHAFEAMCRGQRVVAVDADRTALTEVRGMMGALAAEDRVLQGGSGSVVNADALRLPFLDGSFDRIVAAEVLEHVPADTKAMAEIHRVLRPGGLLAVTVPRFGPELVNWALSDSYHSVKGGHVRIYPRSTLIGRLAEVGFEPVALHHAHSLHSPYWWLRCFVGPGREDHPLVKAYHRFLVWDIVDRPFITRAIGRLLDPFIGKSLVVYLEKAS